MPEAGPFGDTLRERSTRAMVAALLVNNPGGGWVESVFTLATQRFCGLDLVVVLRMKPFPLGCLD